MFLSAFFAQLLLVLSAYSFSPASWLSRNHFSYHPAAAHVALCSEHRTVRSRIIHALRIDTGARILLYVDRLIDSDGCNGCGSRTRLFAIFAPNYIKRERAVNWRRTMKPALTVTTPNPAQVEHETQSATFWSIFKRTCRSILLQIHRSIDWAFVCLEMTFFAALPPLRFAVAFFFSLSRIKF